MDVTLTVALITALLTTFAAIVAPVVTAYITQRGEYKRKSAELFFSAKLNAYREFTQLAAQYGEPTQTPSKEKSQLLHAAASQALLFSSSKTQDAIGRYGKLLLDNAYTPQEIQELSLAYRDMILEMQEELSQYEHPNRRK